MAHVEDLLELLAALEADDKDQLLQHLLRTLAARGIARRWAQSQTPHSDLHRECIEVASHPQFTRKLESYLRANPVLLLSVRTFLAHLSVAANLRAEHVPEPQQVLVPVGIRIARWVPTFLVVDGPLGRFMRSADSPLNVLLRTEHTKYPTLGQARDTFNHDLFRRVRNGVGHWAFAWESNANGGRLICFDWESGERTAEISLLEAEALHVASFSVIESLDRRLFSRVGGRSSSI